MKPKFKPTRDGLVIIDPIERKQYRFETDSPVTPTPVTDDGVPYPMDSAVEVVTRGLKVLSDNSLHVRDSNGSLIAELQANKQVELPRSEYILDLSGPMKVYIAVKSSLRICGGIGKADIFFGEETTITISARSYHTSPAATIRTTTEPADVMQAVSMFGSTLKTTTPERSYPTLRGHPPAVELADELDIPDELSRPQTGIRIEIPPTLRHTFVVAPLAYYLAATVVPGPTPCLGTENGFTYPLENEMGFEQTVDHVFRHIFLLDCIVRTEGGTPIPLHERQAIESVLDFDTGTIYDRPIAERIATYLEIPLEDVQSQFPEWRFKAYVEPRAESTEFLPFLMDCLAAIKIKSSRQTPVRTAMKNSATESPIVKQSWSDDQTEITATGTVSAFQNNVTQSPRDGPLDIKVVCNEPEMSDEFATVHGTYQNRKDLPLDVTVHHDLQTDELERVFTEESDFVHYIGHVDSDGFRCSDGTMAAEDIETVGTKAFILNACRSYDQGLRLIEAGAIGGIVTFAEIENRTAVSAGQTIARLLNFGLPLYGALHILQKIGDGCQQYHIVGDGTLTVVQTSQGAPITASIPDSEDRHNVIVDSYISPSKNTGSIYKPSTTAADLYRLVFSKADLQPESTAELIEFLNTDTFPVVFNGELRWSTDIKTHEL